MIRAVHGASAYHINLLGLVETQDDVINIKFDTGASYTVISLNTLLGTDEEEKLKQFSDAIPKYKSRRNFTWASGNDMEGVLCHAENIVLSGCKIKDFYYYLILFDEKSAKDKDRDRRLALLGDDFISCCKFTHSVGGDIIIDAFDDERYVENEEYESKCLLNTDEISELYIDLIDRSNKEDIILLGDNGKALTEEEVLKEIFED